MAAHPEDRSHTGPIADLPPEQQAIARAVVDAASAAQDTFLNELHRRLPRGALDADVLAHIDYRVSSDYADAWRECIS